MRQHDVVPATALGEAMRVESVRAPRVSVAAAGNRLAGARAHEQRAQRQRIRRIRSAALQTNFKEAAAAGRGEEQDGDVVVGGRQSVESEPK